MILFGFSNRVKSALRSLEVSAMEDKKNKMARFAFFLISNF